MQWINNIADGSIDNYFTILSHHGYIDHGSVKKLLALIFIEEVFNKQYVKDITEKDYKILNRILYNLAGCTCLIPYKEFSKGTATITLQIPRSNARSISLLPGIINVDAGKAQSLRLLPYSMNIGAKGSQVQLGLTNIAATKSIVQLKLNASVKGNVHPIYNGHDCDVNCCNDINETLIIIPSSSNIDYTGGKVLLQLRSIG